jgi:hypothetical protein
MSWVKTLGFGGNGVVALFQVNGSKKLANKTKIVVKIPLHENAASLLERELSFHRLLKQAGHCVQAVDIDLRPTLRKNIRRWTGLARAGVRAGMRIAAPWLARPALAPGVVFGAADIPAIQNMADKVLIQEFMEHGDLNRWVLKLMRENNRFSDKMLWMILDCCKL